MYYCGVFPLGVQNIYFVQSEKSNFTFVKSMKELCKEQLRKGKKSMEKKIMEAFSCYKISFVIFQSKKTARTH